MHALPLLIGFIVGCLFTLFVFDATDPYSELRYGYKTVEEDARRP